MRFRVIRKLMWRIYGYRHAGNGAADDQTAARDAAYEYVKRLMNERYGRQCIIRIQVAMMPGGVVRYYWSVWCRPAVGA